MNVLLVALKNGYGVSMYRDGDEYCVVLSKRSKSDRRWTRKRCYRVMDGVKLALVELEKE